MRAGLLGDGNGRARMGSDPDRARWPRRRVARTQGARRVRTNWGLTLSCTDSSRIAASIRARSGSDPIVQTWHRSRRHWRADMRHVRSASLVPMARRPREDPGDTHHVFMRGVERVARRRGCRRLRARACACLQRAVARFELDCHAWCFLPNHAHLLVTSPLGNLSRGDAVVLGTCSADVQPAPRARRDTSIQGRFGSRLVEDERHLLELVRYIPLNPVRAGICRSPEDWPWSSYTATAGLRPAPCVPRRRRRSSTMLGSAEALRRVGRRRRRERRTSMSTARRGGRRSQTLLLDDSDRGSIAAHFAHGYNITRDRRAPRREPRRRSAGAWPLAPPARSGSDPIVHGADARECAVHSACTHRGQTPFVAVPARIAARSL